MESLIGTTWVGPSAGSFIIDDFARDIPGYGAPIGEIYVGKGSIGASLHNTLITRRALVLRNFLLKEGPGVIGQPPLYEALPAAVYRTWSWARDDRTLTLTQTMQTVGGVYHTSGEIHEARIDLNDEEPEWALVTIDGIVAAGWTPVANDTGSPLPR